MNVFLQLGGNLYGGFLLLGGKHPIYHRLGGNPGFVHLSYLIHPKKASTSVTSRSAKTSVGRRP
eukprot:2239145-Prymnesium_polylepis.1